MHWIAPTEKDTAAEQVAPAPHFTKAEYKGARLEGLVLALQRHFVGRLPPAGAGSGDPAYNDGSWKPHGSRSVAVVLIIFPSVFHGISQ